MCREVLWVTGGEGTRPNGAAARRAALLRILCPSPNPAIHKPLAVSTNSPTVQFGSCLVSAQTKRRSCSCDAQPRVASANRRTYLLLCTIAHRLRLCTPGHRLRLCTTTHQHPCPCQSPTCNPFQSHRLRCLRFRVHSCTTALLRPPCSSTFR